MILAVHADAVRADQTDWTEIVALYDLLLRVQASPVVALNRAVAVAMRDGPAEGLKLIDSLLSQGRLDTYYLAHSARGELLRRLGRSAEARNAFEKAFTLVKQEPERRLLRRKLAMLPDE